MILIGIDAGVRNGIAVYDTSTKKWDHLKECHIWDVFNLLDSLVDDGEESISAKVYLDDARLVKYGTDPMKAQGAGWIKTLCGQYEKFLIAKKIKYQLVRPSYSYTKKDAAFVLLQTGIQTKLGHQNLRDAIMLLYFHGLH